MSAHLILVVDDVPSNVKLLGDLLEGSGYDVVTARSGSDALAIVSGAAGRRPDLVLLDVLMPGMTGYDVCRAIRADAATATLPVVMVTALDASAERLRGLEAGADDFLSKPISAPELLARVRSLVRAKDLHDTVVRQAEQLAGWNRTLEERVARQVAELERLARLKRFLPLHVAERVLAGDAADPLVGHRRTIAALFVELRGLTVFAETRAADEVMAVLREHHADVAELAAAWEGTIERFGGDGTMIVFNDPVPQADAAVRAIALGRAVIDRGRALVERWERRGFELSLAAGVSYGDATLGAIGVEGRSDYAAVGVVTRLACRLCEAAAANEVLVGQAVLAAAGERFEFASAGDLTLRGFLRPVPAFRVGDEKRAAAASPAVGAAGRSFRREGEYWTLAFEDERVRLRDSKGMAYLAHLLRHPEHEVHALELIALLRPEPEPSRAGDAPVRLAGALGDGGPLLDRTAKDAYRSRLEALRSELAEAQANNDRERETRLRAEVEFLAQQIAAAIGLGGRDRPVGAAAERARVNVTRAISDAVKRIAAHAPQLARHLEASVHTGSWCAYRPPRRGEGAWEI